MITYIFAPSDSPDGASATFDEAEAETESNSHHILRDFEINDEPCTVDEGGDKGR